MLCPRCHRLRARSAAPCPVCGALPDGRSQELELVLPDGAHLPVTRTLTIGRGPQSSVRLDDPTVSRAHARVSAVPGAAPVLEDVGSTYGTWLDGERVTGPRELRDGDRLRIGDQALTVERRRADSEAGRTVFVPAGPTGTRFIERPRLRPGLALKRLEAAEGAKRWVLRDPRGGYLRFGDEDADLAGLLDGSRSLAELVAETERRNGSAGVARLTELLAELQARGLLAGAGQADEAAPRGLRGLMRPRRWSVSGAGEFFERLYSRGGWMPFSLPGLALLALIAVAGIFVFAYLVAGRYGTPFVVAQKVGLGGLVFVLGRLAIASVHETAHGLAMAAIGRRAGDAGLKLVLVFPYAYVDTSEAWFEPRRRRILVSAAGPLSDFTLGGLFSLLALVTAPGTLRDILFQLAFAAYVGGLFNLNPFLERDGYHILVDLLGEPALRRRAREQLQRRLGRGDSRGSSPVLARYSLYGLAWSTLAGLFAVGMSLRYEPRIASLLPQPLTWVVLALIWITCFAPVILALWAPLRERGQRRTA